MQKPVFSFSNIQARRQRLLNEIGDALLILPAATDLIRNRDCHFPFRQDSDFLYLSQFNEPDAVMVLDGKTKQSILFSKPYDELHAIWEGEIIGQTRAEQEYLFDIAYPIEVLEEKLLKLLFSHETIIAPFSRYPAFDSLLLKLVAKVKNTRRARAPERLLHSDLWLAPMRLQKDEEEIAMMLYASDVSMLAHKKAMAGAKHCQNESEVAAIFDYYYTRAGGAPAYSHIVASGNNACTLHYRENNQKLDPSQLILIDAGCEIDGYAADISRTFPINGKFTPIQKRVYEWVLKSMDAAIEASLPGNHIRSPHEAARDVLIDAMLDLGLVTGTRESVLESESYLKYFMHGTSHWLGIDVHDVGDYLDENGNWLTLKPGMVITIEPGIYIREDDESAPEALRGIGIRIEDNILITETGYRNLSEGMPKTVEAVEAACAEVFTLTD